MRYNGIMNNQFLIGLIRNAYDGLARTVSAVPDDKMTWKPLDNGRTVLDLLGDAAQTAGMTAQMAQTRGEVKPSYEMFQQLKAERENWTRKDATRALRTTRKNSMQPLNNCRTKNWRKK